MEAKSAWKATPQVVLGLIIIIIGVLFTLDNLDIIYAHDYFRYWPALLIIYGVSKMIQPRGRSGRFMGLILTFIGAALLIDRLDFFYFRLWDFWPLIIVIIGLSMIWRTSRRTGSPDHMTTLPPDTDSIVSGTAILSGFRRTSSSQDFRGGELTAIMGGCEIDLRQASIKEGDAQHFVPVRQAQPLGLQACGQRGIGSRTIGRSTVVHDVSAREGHAVDGPRREVVAREAESVGRERVSSEGKGGAAACH